MADTVTPELKLRVDDLYAAYAETICDGRIEEWPGFFTDPCFYRVVARANLERDRPLSVIYSQSRGALVDRVTAVKNALVYAPRYVTYLVGGVRVVRRAGDLLETRSMLSVYHTLLDGDAQLFIVARTFDKLALAPDGLKFRERQVVFDSERVPGALVYPL